MGGTGSNTPVNIRRINKHDGVSHTALLAHKGMEPKHYETQSASMTYFAGGGYSFTNPFGQLQNRHGPSRLLRITTSAGPT